MIIIVTSGLGVAIPLLIKVLFDRALFCGSDCPNLGLLYTLVGLMIAITVVTTALGVVQTYLANTTGQRVMLELRQRLYEHLQRQSLGFFTGTKTGEIQSRLANDVGGIQSVVTNTVASVLANFVIFASTVVAMTVMSWQLTILSLGITPVFFLLMSRVGRRARGIMESAQESRAGMSAITQETLSVSGMLLTKVFNRHEQEIERFRQENLRLADLEVRRQMVGQGFMALIQGFFSMTPVIVYLVAGQLMSSRVATGITAGTLVAFTALQTRAFFPVAQMLGTGVELSAAMALFRRVFEYLDLPPHIVDRPHAQALASNQVRGAVRLDHVFFRYGESIQSENGDAPDTAPTFEIDKGWSRRLWALEDVSLDIAPGQLAALVGPSGAGKTTASYLVPRLYDVTSGAVLIDGVDVRDVKRSSLADAVGIVTQETYLFHSTLRQNLLYAKPDATQADLDAATKAALIYDMIQGLDDGYDSVVGERGYKLSGGEKQRIAIARAILKNPKILILDEATSALDSTSERLINEAMEPLMQGRTTIAIAHRLSTVLAADIIFVFEAGRLVEQGTHAELLCRGGLYARLYYEQFSRNGGEETQKPVIKKT